MKHDFTFLRAILGGSIKKQFARKIGYTWSCATRYLRGRVKAVGLPGTVHNLEFLGGAREILEAPPSPIKIALAGAICTLLIIALGISWFFHVDIYAVADGRIQPAGRSKVVQPLYQGTVLGIRAEEGKYVKAGDVLLELDPTEARAEQQKAESQFFALAAEIARRQEALASLSHGVTKMISPISFPSGTAQEIQSRETTVLRADMEELAASVDVAGAKVKEDETLLAGAKETLAEREALIVTLRKRVTMREALEKDGWESRSNLLDAEETLEREEAERSSDFSRVSQYESEIQSQTQQKREVISQFVSNYTKDLEKAEADRDAAQQELIKAQAQLMHSKIVAPISGTLQQLAVTTVGQVVSPGQQLMTIVPKWADIEIVALVRNEDIGFVHVGQDAVVKVDAFPFTRYGTLKGIVTKISRDSVALEDDPGQDSQQKIPMAASADADPLPKTRELIFSVTIKLMQRELLVDGTEAPVVPGMHCIAEIRTGDRRVLDYVLSPFISTGSSALHER